MACEYCENAWRNKPLVESESEDKGVMVSIIHDAEGLCIDAFGWCCGIVNMKSEIAKINFCPMCGAGVER